MNVNLKALIGKLNKETRSAVESAAGLCLSRTHYDVEIEHFLLKALDATDGDLSFAFRHFGIDRSRLAGDLQRSLDKLRSGNARTPALSPTLVRVLTDGWTLGSVEFGAGQVRTGHVLLALTADDDLRRMALDISREFEKIPAESLRKDFAAITAESSEERTAVAGGGAAGSSSAPGQPRPGGKTPFLDQYSQDLTQRARDGKMDPILGRDTEVRQVVDILTRRRQNNPILVGEAGVGKTAVVEGFAVRIANGDVPPALRGVSLRSLDLALLQAGAGVKGEFENRLKGLIEEVKNSETPIILFIDEAHTMIGAGGQAGQNDAANLLKPALARGELRTIAATTWSEYKKFFEKDPALSRRFQLVKVEEPSELTCALMLRGVVPALERHHGVRILDDGLEAAVRLSHRYIPDRQLPDKAVSVLDTACARLALGQSTTPPPLEDTLRRLDDLEVQERVLLREAAVGTDHGERLGEIAAQRARAELSRDELAGRWGRERDLVTTIRDLRVRLEGELPDAPAGNGADASPALSAEEAQGALAELARLNDELTELQGDTPLMRICVDAQLIGEVISGWTGVPVGKMLTDEVATVLRLEQHLGVRVIGQDHAMEIISRRVRTSRADIEDPSKPKGVFMLVGPSGVGKTETALAIADLLYGGERNLISINMSEFQEAHTVEKAHPDVLELFFQVFDKGNMEDGEGRSIDFKNTVILLTTNAGTDTIMKLTGDPEMMPNHEGLVKALKPELNATFKPAFLGRMVIIPYFPVRDEALKQIIRLKVGKLQRRLQETHRMALLFDESLVDAIADRCTEVESGARNVDNILTNSLMPEISRMILESVAEGVKPSAVRVSVGEGGFEYEMEHGVSAPADAIASPTADLPVA